MPFSKDEQNALLAGAVGVVMFLGIWAYTIIHYGFLGFFLGWIPSSFLALVIGGAIFIMGFITGE